MIRYHKPFYGNRFIGDTSKMVFHDTLYEKKFSTDQTCNIDKIKTNKIKTFSPDKKSQAIKEGFKPCPICLPYNQKF